MYLKLKIGTYEPDGCRETKERGNQETPFKERAEMYFDHYSSLPKNILSLARACVGVGSFCFQSHQCVAMN